MRRRGWQYRHPPNGEFTINRSSPQAQGLVAWWPMLASRGANALRDLSRGGHIGIITGASWVNEPFAPGLFFQNGAADFVTVSPGIPMIAPFSLVSWARPTSATTRGLLGSVSGVDSWYVVSETDRVLFRQNTGTQSAAVAYTATGNAQHYVFTLNSDASDWNWYVDGRNIGNGANITATTYLDLTEIGRFWENNSYVFDGVIYEVRVYNRALSPAEVYQCYSPDTRWDLYQPVRRRFAVKAPAGGVVVPVMDHHYRMRRTA